MIKVTAEEYSEMTENYQGICLDCKEKFIDSVEPDAEHYECPYCENFKVMGIEWALLSGEIEIEE